MKTLISIVVLVALIGLGAYIFQNRENFIPVPVNTDTNNPSGNSTTTSDSNIPSAPSSLNNLIRVSSPIPNSVVRSPLTVSGEARGNWYFEASFPVKIIDSSGNVLAVVPAQAQGEWMTTEFVPFSVTIPFASTTSASGFIVLEKDNPSGLPENAAELLIPIRFR